MAASAEFIGFLKEQMAGFGAVTARRMFSGAGLYRDGVIFALIVQDTLYLKADAESRPGFEAEGLGPFTYDTKHGERTIPSYWRCPERCLDDPGEMTTWCRTAWDAALRAGIAKQKPAKKKR